MARHDPDRYRVQILAPSYPQLKSLIAQDVFHPTSEVMWDDQHLTDVMDGG